MRGVLAQGGQGDKSTIPLVHGRLRLCSSCRSPLCSQQQDSSWPHHSLPRAVSDVLHGDWLLLLLRIES